MLSEKLWDISRRVSDKYRTFKHFFIPKLQASSISVPPASGMPDVSIVIPVYGQLEFTLRCISSIVSSKPKCAFEIIVIDDASPIGCVEELRRVKGARLIENTKNLGFIRSCNVASVHTNGQYIHFLNNDTVVLPGAIDALFSTVEQDKNVGLVGSKLVYPNGKLQEAGGIIWLDGNGHNYGRYHNPDLPEYNYLRDVDYCSGASILVPRDVWLELGGFDELFAPAYYEDTDFAFRVRELGRRVVYQPRSTVVHHEGISHGTAPSAGGKTHQEKNRIKFVKKWRNILISRHYPSSTPLSRARDRTMGKPVILVVDHYVPEPDRDAGSRAILALMQGLLDAGYGVKFWPENLVYHPDYHQVLEGMGIEIFTEKRATKFIPNWERRTRAAFETCLHENDGSIDGILVARPQVAKSLFSSILKSTVVPIAYYGHDLHHTRLEMEAHRTGSAETLLNAQKMKEMELAAWGMADVVLYLSKEEADEARRLSPNINSAVIQPYSFSEFNERKIQPSEPLLLFVAGFGHPPNVDAAFWLVEEIFPLVKKRCPDVRLVIAGSHPNERVKALAGKSIEVTGSISAEQLRRYYDQATLAVIPLRIGAGVKLKVVEAMQMGVPVVTTSIGAQGLSEFAKFGSVKDDTAAFVEQVVLLIEKPSLALKLSKRQTVFVKKNFTPASLSAQVKEIFEGIGVCAFEHRSPKSPTL